MKSTGWLEKIADIPREEWNSLAVPLETPLLEWEWLNRMEASGSVSARAGWLPRHLVLRSGRRIVAAAPLYIKSHSAGEFVWDHIWAEVAGRLGARYYPKLVGMSPATPAVGYRFLIAPGEDRAEVTARMMHEIDALCRSQRLGGASFLFVDPAWREEVQGHGYLGWRHQSFCWENPGFSSFEDYLGVFNKNQRRNIRRERSRLEAQELVVRAFTGEEIPDSFFPLMARLYQSTNAQFGPWAARYLTREFFLGLAEDFRHRLVFAAALPARGRRAGEGRAGGAPHPVAMSMLLYKGSVLLGRYWGTTEYLDSLHFNVCYYSPIEWAIRRGVRTFDPGAGSEHKLRRGFRAVANTSLHRFSQPLLRQVMAAHIEEINRMEQEQIEEMNSELPLARTRDADA